MKQNYPLKIDKESMAYASGMNIGVSTKVAIEISSYIRGLPLAKAIVRLERVIKMKDAVPYRRFNSDVGHKPGIGPGRYPIKACEEFISLLESAKANALDKGLAEEALMIIHLSANKAAQQWRYGRQRRRKMKRTNLKVVLAEAEDKKTGKKAPAKKAAKPEEKPKAEAKPAKTEAKPEVKAEEKAPEAKAPAKQETKPAPKKAKPEATPQPKVKESPKEEAEPKAETKKDAKPELKAEVKPEPKVEAKHDPKPAEKKPEAKPEAKEEPKEAKPETQKSPEKKPEAKSE